VSKNRDVAKAIKQLEGVQSVDVVTGPYCIIAVIEGVDLVAIGEIVTSKFHSIGGISRTVTCLGIGSL
ncbi:Lrp/AsnC ligand binding domain-containing protein, partial [Chloroflexota bacterium]